MKVLVKLPVELIEEVATCKVVPSYISYFVGLKLDRIAPLNFRLLNLIGVNDGIGVAGWMTVWAWIEGSDSKTCAEPRELCFSVKLMTFTVLVDVLMSSRSENLRTSPDDAGTMAWGPQTPLLVTQSNADPYNTNSEPPLHCAVKVKLIKPPDEAPVRPIKADKLWDPVAGQVIVGILREPVKLVIPVDEVAL